MAVQTSLATLDDLDEIVRLWMKFTEEMGTATKTTIDVDQWIKSRLHPQLQDSKVVIARLEQECVGFIGSIDRHHRNWVLDDIIYIVDLYVVPHARTSCATQRLYHTAKEKIWNHYAETWANTHVSNHRMQVILKRWKFEPLHDFSIPGTYDQYYYRRVNPDCDHAKRSFVAAVK